MSKIKQSRLASNIPCTKYDPGLLMFFSISPDFLYLLRPWLSGMRHHAQLGCLFQRFHEFLCSSVSLYGTPYILVGICVGFLGVFLLLLAEGVHATTNCKPLKVRGQALGLSSFFSPCGSRNQPGSSGLAASASPAKPSRWPQFLIFNFMFTTSSVWWLFPFLR